MKLFDTNVVAMSFYDKNGHLLDLNQKMKEVCEFNEERELYFRTTKLFDIPNYDFVNNLREPLHTCQHMYYSDLNLNKYIESKSDNKQYFK